MEYAVIMAGGSGTRLWPLSRRGMPKQLLPLIGDRSLLQLAVERATTVVDPSRVLICAGRSYVDVIVSQLPGIPRDNVLGEPQGRDSLAAAAWSTSQIARRDPEATVAVLSADHVISPMSQFTACLARAYDAADRDPSMRSWTLGVVPTSPHTGFGYLHVGGKVAGLDGVYHVEQFAEKPQAEVAERYLAEGGWLWNSGMFCWRAATFLHQLQILEPEFAAEIDHLTDHPDLIDTIYPTLKKTSVDYAVMEPSSLGEGDAHVLTVPLEASWADVGGFPALAEQTKKAEGALPVQGRVVQMDSADNLIINRADDDHLIAVAGVKDLIIVESGNVTLVCSMQASEDIKGLVDLARAQGEQYA